MGEDASRILGDAKTNENLTATTKEGLLRRKPRFGDSCLSLKVDVKFTVRQWSCGAHWCMYLLCGSVSSGCDHCCSLLCSPPLSRFSLYVVFYAGVYRVTSAAPSYDSTRSAIPPPPPPPAPNQPRTVTSKIVIRRLVLGSRLH